MNIFDDFYRPDTPSQRWRLMAASIPALLGTALALTPPLSLWLAGTGFFRVGANVVATSLDLMGVKEPYPSAWWLAQLLLVVGALVGLLKGTGLQIQVLKQFAPQSLTLKLAQRLLMAYGVALLVLGWPIYQLLNN